ncbi:MAG: hypothetical protein DME86_07460 [Verrucomicrobia bacterium]|nr:MAG: hypothetical protein DME86_07460 [Verrucomicrobiota bacterium]
MQTVAIAHLIVTVGRHTLPQIVLSVVSTPFLNANTAKPKIIDDGTVIKNVIVISPERSRAPPNAVVVIRGGRIAEIGTNFLPTHRGARSISQLAEGSKISRQAITKVLRVLEEAGLVRAEMVDGNVFTHSSPRRWTRRKITSRSSRDNGSRRSPG